MIDTRPQQNSTGNTYLDVSDRKTYSQPLGQRL